MKATLTQKLNIVKSNKRRHETAFSATCPTEINDIDKDKKIKKVSTRPPDTVRTSSTDH